MNRRNFLAALAAIPFVGKVVPKSAIAGYPGKGVGSSIPEKAYEWENFTFRYFHDEDREVRHYISTPGSGDDYWRRMIENDHKYKTLDFKIMDGTRTG